MSFTKTLRNWWSALLGRPDISGEWTLEVWESGCGAPGAIKLPAFAVTVTQRGNSIVLSAGGVTLDGWLEGHFLAVSGRYLEERRTTEEHLTATVNALGTELTGGSVWTWGVGSSDPNPCGGTTTCSGVKTLSSGD